jgi:hypothetical protein
MSEPYWTPDTEQLSNCCGALSGTEIVDDISICSDCGEWASFDDSILDKKFDEIKYERMVENA